jgi:hypothetical protein
LFYLKRVRYKPIDYDNAHPVIEASRRLPVQKFKTIRGYSEVFLFGCSCFARPRPFSGVWRLYLRVNNEILFHMIISIACGLRFKKQLATASLLLGATQS